jgi:hypothetical protein
MHSNTLKVGDWVTFDNPYSLPAPVMRLNQYNRLDSKDLCGKVLSIDNDMITVKNHYGVYNTHKPVIEIPYWFLKCINPTDITGQILTIGDIVYIVYDKTMMVKGKYIKETGPKYVKHNGYRIGIKVEYTNMYNNISSVINYGPESVIKV